MDGWSRFVSIYVTLVIATLAWRSPGQLVFHRSTASIAGSYLDGHYTLICEEPDIPKPMTITSQWRVQRMLIALRTPLTYPWAIQR